MDIQLPELYNQFWFMKKHGNFTIPEMYMLHPFEFEIYYYMLVNDIKKENEARAKANQQQR